MGETAQSITANLYPSALLAQALDNFDLTLFFH